jgi:thiosulfate dehydrogenase [quinone] large subunit
MTDVKLNPAGLFLMTILRVMIGWHLLYEGLVKWSNDDWSAGPFLLQSKWIFRNLYLWIANTDEVLEVVNFLNTWGLILIGAGLIIGLFTRIACFCGAALLLLYYLANPPLPQLHYSTPMEGNYLIINKNLIESAALLALAFIPTGRYLGLDRIRTGWWRILRTRKS